MGNGIPVNKLKSEWRAHVAVVVGHRAGGNHPRASGARLIADWTIKRVKVAI